MGFTTAVTTAASVIPVIYAAAAQRQESKNLNRAAQEQERLARRNSNALVDTAAGNQIRAARNANDQLASARVDAAASNLAESGSTSVRERDLATRLQDEINNNANLTLQQANSTLRQGMLNAWNTRNMARQAKANSVASGVGALGSLIGGIAGGLSGNRSSN